MAIITLGAGQKYKFTSSGSNLQFKEGSDHPLGMTIASGGLQAHGNLEIISVCFAKSLTLLTSSSSTRIPISPQ